MEPPTSAKAKESVQDKCLGDGKQARAVGGVSHLASLNR